MTLDEAVSLMRGPAATEIDLTIQRGDEVFEVHIVRELINVVSVPDYYIVDEDYGIGYIAITNFSERTYEELVQALDALDAQGQRALIWICATIQAELWALLCVWLTSLWPALPCSTWRTRKATALPLRAWRKEPESPCPWWS